MAVLRLSVVSQAQRPNEEAAAAEQEATRGAGRGAASWASHSDCARAEQLLVGGCVPGCAAAAEPELSDEEPEPLKHTDPPSDTVSAFTGPAGPGSGLNSFIEPGCNQLLTGLTRAWRGGGLQDCL